MEVSESLNSCGELSKCVIMNGLNKCGNSEYYMQKRASSAFLYSTKYPSVFGGTTFLDLHYCIFREFNTNVVNKLLDQSKHQ